MKDKIKILSGGEQKDVMKEAIRGMKEQLPDMVEYYSICAKMHKAKYEALINEGFIPDEALELCKILY